MSGDGGAVLHVCYDLIPGSRRPLAYEHLLHPGAVCGHCGWSTDWPLPSVTDCAHRLTTTVGPHAGTVWARALLDFMEQTPWR